MKINKILLVIGIVHVLSSRAAGDCAIGSAGARDRNRGVFPSLAALCTTFAVEHEHEIAQHVSDRASYLPDRLNERIDEELRSLFRSAVGRGSLEGLLMLKTLVKEHLIEECTVKKHKHLVTKLHINNAFLIDLFQGATVSQCMANYLAKHGVVCRREDRQTANFFEMGFIY